MILAAYCPSCSEVRAQTGELAPGTRPGGADFIPVNGQDQPVDNTPAVCTKCKTNLIFRRVPERTANEHIADAPPREPTRGVSTLFQLASGEEIRDTKQLTSDVYVIFTNRRIVKVDLTALAEEA
jgi:hypothetical protein